MKSTFTLILVMLWFSAHSQDTLMEFKEAFTISHIRTFLDFKSIELKTGNKTTPYQGSDIINHYYFIDNIKVESKRDSLNLKLIKRSKNVFITTFENFDSYDDIFVARDSSLNAYFYTYKKDTAILISGFTANSKYNTKALSTQDIYNKVGSEILLKKIRNLEPLTKNANYKYVSLSCSFVAEDFTQGYSLNFPQELILVVSTENLKKLINLEITNNEFLTLCDFYSYNKELEKVSVILK